MEFQMGRFLIALGLAIVVGGIWITTEFASEAPEPPVLDRIGSGFNSSLQIPREEINEQIAVANAVADEMVAHSITMKDRGEFALMLVIVLGGLTTMVAGLQKLAGDGPAIGFTVALALLGAGSAGATGYAKYASDTSDAGFKCVDALEDHVAETIAALQSETDETAARQYLADMARQAARC